MKNSVILSNIKLVLDFKTLENKGVFDMDAGSIAFMIICAGLVFLMTPGLAFFYGGLGRRKMLSIR